MGNTATEYNGWRNYQTLIVNQWLTLAAERSDMLFLEEALACWAATNAEDTAEDRDVEAARQLAPRLEAYCEDELDLRLDMTQASMLVDLSVSALAAVDWHEIAEHMITDLDFKPADGRLLVRLRSKATT